MIIARWHIQARFGHKQQALDCLKRWHEEVGTQIGWHKQNCRILSGSIGAKESEICSEVELPDLAALHSAWEKLASIDSHKDWSKELEPNIVSGSAYWDVYRVEQ
ncbi:MAG: hypothetical protein RPR40_02610 [Bermanella sp.]|jgi:hypothetical protein